MKNPELERLLKSEDNKGWKMWGPYLSERQWGTVREDYSLDGSAWEYITHDKARSNAYRWGEEGIGGISDHKQVLCMSFAFWNQKDPILKERMFGLSGNEGNHGEDVKELYYYLDSSPTHSYMKMLYKYPIEEYPYAELAAEARKRNRHEREYEIVDTGVFNDDKYFNIYIEYAKKSEHDLLMKVTVENRHSEEAKINVLPHIWFRNNWNHKKGKLKPFVKKDSDGAIKSHCTEYGTYFLYCDENPELLFCNNETNNEKVHGIPNTEMYPKDGINDYIVNDVKNTVDPDFIGTKAAANYELTIPANSKKEVRIRFVQDGIENPFDDFNQIFEERLQETEDYYTIMQQKIKSPELQNVQRQAFAGMMWSKQFYYYDVFRWLNGDENSFSPYRNNRRNDQWEHLYNKNILSMPDKWEYPWYAAWDLAFHCIPLAHLDPFFAKRQLSLLLREYYMHPNGQIPAYEWNFGDVNPPVHAWAVWKVYEIDKEITGKPDLVFLEKLFQKLMINFTWWVNQKDTEGKNIFDGGFLGLDNIGVFDRSHLPDGVKNLEQADATSWMAMYALNMLRIALELSGDNLAYEETASKFFQHFMFIAGALANIGDDKVDLWDDTDKFYYDVIHLEDGHSERMKVRSLVGVIPLFAVEFIQDDLFEKLEDFQRRVQGFLDHRPDLTAQVSRVKELGEMNNHLLSIVRKFRLKRILEKLLDEKEFLSDFGIRSLSKFHEENPYRYEFDGSIHSVSYLPGESDTGMFGGNSNWRGPIWFPLNYMIIQSLYKYHNYYGDDYKYEFPTGSGNQLSLKEIAIELSKRLIKIFLKDGNNKTPYLGNYELLQNKDDFNKNLLFYEFFNGETGEGLGASHQTGWTGLVADLIFDCSSWMPENEKVSSSQEAK